MNKKLFFLYFFPASLFVSFIILGLFSPFLFINQKSVDGFFYQGDRIDFLYSLDLVPILFVLLFALFTAFFYMLLVFKPKNGIFFGFFPWLFFLVLILISGAFMLVPLLLIYFGASAGVILFLSKVYNSVNYRYKKMIAIIPFCALGLLAIFVFVMSPLVLSKIAKTMNDSTLCGLSITEENVSICYDALGIQAKNPSFCSTNYDLEASSGTGSNCIIVAKALAFENIEDIKKDHMKSLYKQYKIGKNNYTAYVPHNKEEFFLYYGQDKFYVNGEKSRENIIVGDDERADFVYCYDKTFGIPDDVIKCTKSIEAFSDGYRDDAIDLGILNAKIEIFNRHYSK